MATSTGPEISYPNFLGKTGFKFELERIPLTSFFGTEFDFISSNMKSIMIDYPTINYPIVGSKQNYTPLKIKFLVDENLKNYSECIEWMYGITNPINLTNNKIFSEKSFREYLKKSSTEISSVYSDGYLHIFDNNNKPNKLVKFHDMFPSYVSGLEFHTNDKNIEYISCEIMFEYSYYTLQ